MLNRELSRLLNEDIKVIGASRTDSGVHAMGNVAVFDSETRIPPEKISFALNQRLPEDIRIHSSCQVADDFHPRFCDTIKTYEYRIWNDRFPNPMVRLYSKFCYFNIDVDKMQEAANYLIGEHDFASFCTGASKKKSTVRKVDQIEIVQRGPYIYLTFHGEGFLRNMVRILTGTLLEVGFGKREPENMLTLLEAKNRKLAGYTAPPQGLCLIEVDYD